MRLAPRTQTIRAQLRACVYNALLHNAPNLSAPSIATSPEARLALAVLEEFLQFHTLASTASTMAAEAVGWSDRTPLEAAAAELSLTLGSPQPLLLQLISSRRSSASAAPLEAKAKSHASGPTSALPPAPSEVLAGDSPSAPATPAADSHFPTGASAAPISASASTAPAPPVASASAGGGAALSGTPCSAALPRVAPLTTPGGVQHGSASAASALSPPGGRSRPPAALPSVGGASAAAGRKALPSLAPLKGLGAASASEEEFARERRLAAEEAEAARKAAAEDAARSEAAAAQEEAEAARVAAEEAAAREAAAREAKAADVARVLAEVDAARQREDELADSRSLAGRAPKLGGGGGGLWGDSGGGGPTTDASAARAGRRGGGGGGGLDAFMRKEQEKERPAGRGGGGGLDAFMQREQQKERSRKPPPANDAPAASPSPSPRASPASSPRRSGTQHPPPAASAAPTAPTPAPAPDDARHPLRAAAAAADDSDASIELEGATDSEEEGGVGLSPAKESPKDRPGFAARSGFGGGGGGGSGGGGGGGSGTTLRSALSMLEAESDDSDDGNVMGGLSARAKQTAVRKVAPQAGAAAPKLKWDDEDDKPPPRAAAARSAVPMVRTAPVAPPIDDEPAFEIEEDLDAIDLDDEEIDPW